MFYFFLFVANVSAIFCTKGNIIDFEILDDFVFHFHTQKCCAQETTFNHLIWTVRVETHNLLYRQSTFLYCPLHILHLRTAGFSPDNIKIP